MGSKNGQAASGERKQGEVSSEQEEKRVGKRQAASGKRKQEEVSSEQ
jgi:hypothetical protein